MTVMRPVTPPLLAVLTVLALTVTGCGESTGGSDAGSAPGGDDATTPVDGTYVASDVAGRALVDGTTLRLTWDDGILSADAGCNAMSGRALVADGLLVVDDLATTEMGCEPARMEQDEWVADLLTSGPELTPDGDGFTLSGPAASVGWTPERVPPDLSLEGRTWLHESTVDGDVASSSAGGSDDALPRLRIADGRVVAFDGCDEITGRVEVTAGSIRPSGDLGGTARQCIVAGVPLAQLLRGSSYVVEGDRLTLTRGETSLIFRAG